MKEVFITLLWIVFIADSVLLVLIVLLQSGRGGGLSGMLGGAGMAESALGPKSGLPRITGIMAGVFFATAILISIMSRPKEAMDPKAPRGARPKAEQATPAPEARPKADEPRGKGEGPKPDGGEAGPPKPPAPGTPTTPGKAP